MIIKKTNKHLGYCITFFKDNDNFQYLLLQTSKTMRGELYYSGTINNYSKFLNELIISEKFNILNKLQNVRRIIIIIYPSKNELDRYDKSLLISGWENGPKCSGFYF